MSIIEELETSFKNPRIIVTSFYILASEKKSK